MTPPYRTPEINTLTKVQNSNCRGRRPRRPSSKTLRFLSASGEFVTFQNGPSRAPAPTKRFFDSLKQNPRSFERGFCGAADRTRTGTELPPADFKSAVSTIPPQRHIPDYSSTAVQNRQVGNGTQAVPYCFISAAPPETPRTFPGIPPGSHHYIMYRRTSPGTSFRSFGR